MFDFKTWSHYSVFPYECSSIECLQLFLVDNRYIVVRNADEVIILDAETRFSLINNISHEIPDMLTILSRRNVHHEEPTVIPSITSHNNLVVIIIATVVTGTVIITILIIFFGFGIQLLRKHR